MYSTSLHNYVVLTPLQLRGYEDGRTKRWHEQHCRALKASCEANEGGFDNVWDEEVTNEDTPPTVADLRVVPFRYESSSEICEGITKLLGKRPSNLEKCL